jgi:hypothetical protein
MGDSVLQKFDASLSQYQHLIATIEALSTFAAVVVSLVLALMAQRANRTKLSANLFVSTIVHDSIDPENSPEYLTLSITNKGVMPFTIPFSFFCWRIPFQRISAVVSPLDYFTGDPYISARPYPVQIAPRSMERFNLSTGEMIRGNFRKIYQDQSWLGRHLFRLLHARVTTEDGTVCRVRLDKHVRDAINAARREGEPRTGEC